MNISELAVKYKKITLVVLLIIGFVLGFGFKSCTGVKKDDYNDLLAQVDTLTADNQSVSSEKDKFQKSMKIIKPK